MLEFPGEAAPENMNSWRPQRHRREPVRRIQCVAADVSFVDAGDRDAGLFGDAGQPVQVPVDGQGFPSGVGEDRRVEAGNAPVHGEQEHR